MIEIPTFVDRNKVIKQAVLEVERYKGSNFKPSLRPKESNKNIKR